MKKTMYVLLTGASALALSVSAFAQITFSGSGLSGLTYLGNPGDAQYVPALALDGVNPPLAQLTTPDAGTSVSADSPAVFVVSPLGLLSSFLATYDLYSSSGEAGLGAGQNQPYWNIGVSPAANPNDLVQIISFGGPSLTQSSQIHAYDGNWNALNGNGYWGDTLAQLDAVTYDGYTVGDMTVQWAGIEIGDWDNGTNTIAAAANFDSITVVPEPGTLALVATGLVGILFVIRRRQA